MYVGELLVKGWWIEVVFAPLWIVRRRASLRSLLGYFPRVLYRNYVRSDDGQRFCSPSCTGSKSLLLGSSEWCGLSFLDSANKLVLLSEFVLSL